MLPETMNHAQASAETIVSAEQPSTYESFDELAIARKRKAMSHLRAVQGANYVERVAMKFSDFLKRGKAA